MKPVIIGFLLGSALGFIASFFYLYSFWLPIIAICILICGTIARLSYRTNIIPSILASLIAFGIYLGVFWAPAEIAAATAESPIEHARAGYLLATRGGHFFGADERAFQHYIKAAEDGHAPSIMVVANAYLYGHYGLSRDTSGARPWLEQGKALGIEEAAKSLASTYHFPKKRANQTGDDNSE
jgi:hypothetical protein